MADNQPYILSLKLLLLSDTNLTENPQASLLIFHLLLKFCLAPPMVYKLGFLYILTLPELHFLDLVSISVLSKIGMFVCTDPGLQLVNLDMVACAQDYIWMSWTQEEILCSASTTPHQTSMVNALYYSVLNSIDNLKANLNHRNDEIM